MSTLKSLMVTKNIGIRFYVSKVNYYAWLNAQKLGSVFTKLDILWKYLYQIVENINGKKTNTNTSFFPFILVVNWFIDYWWSWIKILQSSLSGKCTSIMTHEKVIMPQHYLLKMNKHNEESIVIFVTHKQPS